MTQKTFSPPQGIDEIIDYSNWLIQSQKDRVETQLEMRNTYLLNWEFPNANAKGNEWLVPMVDPKPNAQVRTAANILTNKEPRVTVRIPKEAVEMGIVDRSSAWGIAQWRRLPQQIRALAQPKMPLEKMQETFENVIKYAIRQNDAMRDGALRRDLAIDGFCVDQMVVKCVDQRLVGKWQGNNEISRSARNDKPRNARPDAKMPFVFKRVDPTTFYSDRDDQGLNCAIHRYIRPLREVKKIYGDKIKSKSVDVNELKDDKNFVLFCKQWWRDADFNFWKCAWIEQVNSTYIDIDDKIKRIAWIVDDKGDEIQENTLGFIPYIVKTANGSGNNIMPMLYGVVRSGLWQASSVAWTYRASLPVKMANQQWALEGWVKNQPVPTLDYRSMGITPLEGNQRLVPLLTPENRDIQALLAQTEDAMQDASGVNKLLSGYMQGRQAASLYAMALTAAQQIINPVKDALDYTFAETGRMVFQYLKAYADYADEEEDCQLTLYINSKKTVIVPDQIPDYMDIEVSFDPDLPTDKIALMNVAMQAFTSKWLPRERTYELAKLEDMNEIEDMWKAEQSNPTIPPFQPPQGGQQQQPGLPSGTLPPNVMQGYPAPTPTSISKGAERLTGIGRIAQALKNAAKGAR